MRSTDSHANAYLSLPFACQACFVHGDQLLLPRKRIPHKTCRQTDDVTTRRIRFLHRTIPAVRRCSPRRIATTSSDATVLLESTLTSSSSPSYTQSKLCALLQRPHTLYRLPVLLRFMVSGIGISVAGCSDASRGKMISDNKLSKLVLPLNLKDQGEHWVLNHP
ncbi:hypothetical protein CC80DRAFT_495255 [Byssothecium circinans]|uniref:Uncharacterized protein n=1 Tax=Byssothecium circinans TaxID=147558 RepID=A0A6A5TJ88_9PLEO|nr:hypothetical protein CC80DRAFT_495255 [Byssothecium circinans]